MKKINKTHLIIGIDGGGTKTSALVSGFDGELLSSSEVGASNYLIVGLEKSCERIFNLIFDVLKKADSTLNEVSIIIIGLAGAGRQKDKKLILNKLKQIASKNKLKFPRCIILSDAQIALEGAFSSKSGAILIAGTGSILFEKNTKQNINRVGGWGRVLGDEGSGFSIGQKGISAILKSIDGRGAKTKLSKIASEKFGWINSEKIIFDVYKNSFDVASFAPIVFESAKSGDVVSKNILNKTADELVEHLRPIAQKKIKLALVGSIFKNSNYLKNLVVKKIRSSYPKINIVEAEHSPNYGAILYGLRILNDK